MRRKLKRKSYSDFVPGRYYDLQLKSYRGKPFAVRLTGNTRLFHKSFILLDLAGIFQYTLSQAQVKWLLKQERLAKESAGRRR